jgi:hypothetical protein
MYTLWKTHPLITQGKSFILNPSNNKNMFIDQRSVLF